MKFKQYLEKIEEKRIPGFDGYAINKKRAKGFARKITSKSIFGNPRLAIPKIGDEDMSPEAKKRNDMIRYRSKI